MALADMTDPGGPVPDFDLNVLVVDDEAFDRKRLERLASKLGASVSVRTCRDEADFRASLDSGVYDICFVDNNMGAWCGAQAVDVLHHHPHHKETPVVMVSSRDDTETAVQAIKAGCINYIEKGKLTADRLRETVCEALTENLADAVSREQLQQVADCIVTGLAEGCIGELRPRLRAMYRQICFIRDCHAAGVMPSPEALETIETNCLQIWRFADELSDYGRTFSRPQ